MEDKGKGKEEEAVYGKESIMDVEDIEEDTEVGVIITDSKRRCQDLEASKAVNDTQENTNPKGWVLLWNRPASHHEFDMLKLSWAWESMYN
ncbi:hypothetical protein JCGZ_01774 [Jatropha curcas]|uniref:Uncharacterized protein n=1 Tax=Jatropha curcas TaxID=180498 RepID=A0A067JJB7_JATCU|nr:hypothetical protein JCGZ_01774 [Jatropha curcas]